MSSNSCDSSELSYSESDIAEKFLFFNVLKDGRIHFFPFPTTKTVPPPNSDSILSKDINISPDVSARIFLPYSATVTASNTRKLPVLVYIHGGAFLRCSAFSEDYTRFVSQVAIEANVIGVSVEYGLFPARPIPACYEDSWDALQWVASHGNGIGPEPWINDYADLGRIFVDSSELNYSESDISEKFFFFNVLKDRRIHILRPSPEKVPPPTSDSVLSKDVKISNDVSARIFIPTSATTGSRSSSQKLPVLVYIHGGGFCMESAFTEHYTRLVSEMALEANIIGVSVEYGLFPSRFISACYEDSWDALQWVASHANGEGSEPWINEYGDLRRIFVGGDSAGGNISHTLLARVGSKGLQGDAKVEGMILIHPYFAEDDKMWMYMCPTNQGPQDPRMKPAAEDLARLGCDRVLVLLAEKDFLYDQGKMYVDELAKSGWKGKLEVMESKDKEHCFHISNHTDLEAVAIRKRIASFINHQS